MMITYVFGQLKNRLQLLQILSRLQILRGISPKTIYNIFINTPNAIKHYKLYALDIQQDIVHIQIDFRGRDTDNILGRHISGWLISIILLENN